MDLPAQAHSPLHDYLENLHNKYRHLDEGAVADYIPELSTVPPSLFGITLVTVDGYVYQVGDTREEFTIQSISKAITYGLALTDHGVEAVNRKVGVEPSGDAFNSISLDPVTGRPRNPMINAGAIATTGLIHERDGVEPMERILATMARYVGHAVTVNDAVYRSESDTGHRNRAIAHLLRNFNILEGQPEEALEIYFKQCSINVTCRDLAVMAACLANNGVNPITGVVALEKRYVDKVLSVMGSCGMYDYSGNWLYRVGMPAKSGVGGGIVAVLPGQFGLAVFSPPLDRQGNSVRGLRVCEELSTHFGLHLFDIARSTSASVLRVAYSAAVISSRKSRVESERRHLEEHGETIRGYELQGDLTFGATESVIRHIMGDSATSSHFIVDLKRVVAVDDASARLWLEALKTLHRFDKKLYFVSTDHVYRFVRFMKHHTSQQLWDELFRFKDRDRAIEWCEDQLLKGTMPIADGEKTVGLGDQELCRGLTSVELANLKEVCKARSYKAGETVFQRGDEADSLFFVQRGAVEVIVRVHGKREKRLTTLSAGMSFGELAMLNEHTRSANVRATTDAVCLELKFQDIAETTRTRMLANLARMLAAKIERDTREIEAMY